MGNKKTIILIIVAAVFVLALGIYGAIYYSGEKGQSLQNSSQNLPQGTGPISITKETTSTTSVPPEVSKIFNLSSYETGSLIRDLSNGGKQSVVSFQTANPTSTFNNLKSQVVSQKFVITGEDDEKHLLSASSGDQLLQISSFSLPTSTAFMISIYKPKQ